MELTKQEEKMIRVHRKRVKVVGKWMADRYYDAWDIFIGKNKWCKYCAVSTTPVSDMLKQNPAANINWSTVRAVKLT